MSPRQFQTTRWSMIVAASRTRSDPHSREALENLCAAYWYPVFAFVVRQGRSRDDALDLTQGYFVSLLESGLLQAADRDRGRFRSFLLATVKQFLSDERKRSAALKRGGAVSFISLEAATSEGRLRAEADDGESPERAFERQWALTIFQRARQRLAAEFAEAGKSDQYRLLQGYLSGDGDARSYAEVSRELGVSEGSIKMAVQRLRQRFGKLLRNEIAETIDSDADLDAEVRHLLSVV
jgi:RNA polymerase sigma factor (sigma-70 family)